MPKIYNLNKLQRSPFDKLYLTNLSFNDYNWKLISPCVYCEIIFWRNIWKINSIHIFGGLNYILEHNKNKDSDQGYCNNIQTQNCFQRVISKSENSFISSGKTKQVSHIHSNIRKFSLNKNHLVKKFFKTFVYQESIYIR